ncbi:MAG TPA: hypothetical protein VIM76_04955 [Candidatus Dormibacteraeota bacterium]
MSPNALVGEPGARRLSPVLFVLVIGCFFLAFAGVSCNTDATKAGLHSLAGSGGASTSQTAALDTCLDALKNVNVVSYSGWDLVFGKDPSLASLPAACDTGTKISARDVSQLNLGPQALAILGLIAGGLALLWALAGSFGIIRHRTRALAAIVFGAATGALLLLDHQHVHDVLLARIAASAGTSAPGFSASAYFNVNPGIGLVIALILVLVAVLYNVAALVIGERPAAVEVPAAPEPPAPT